MYYYLLSFHSLFRWLLVAALLFSIILAYDRLKRKASFTPFANRLRHWTATIAHLQLLLGFTIYFQSPLLKFAMPASAHPLINDQRFFRYIHAGLMLLSIVLITIGSARAKRMSTAAGQYRTMLIWFVIALLIMFIAIPWPFSPFVARPFIRPL
ncbi:hypothetical protein [Pedobacter sp. SYP-B3415]|uniref:hypothetical protein n=1 Tax=Pedobacter sp. SYP-B3415 TaxID=2496641 RepID=UPI00101BC17D|nr:hypothetical protein [Pedobacter sp. SYP-B3415]